MKFVPDYNHLADTYASEYDKVFLVNSEDHNESLFEDDYEKKYRKILQELSAAIPTSKYPCFEAEVLKRTWNFTTHYATTGKGRKLSLEKKFYVYVLMDPRKSGPWIVTLPGGASFELPFLPFYVGKGFGRRLKKHVEQARNLKDKGRKLTLKHNTILKIERLGLKVVEQKISVKLVEAMALAKEEILIEAIGRVYVGTGPLANTTTGGEGSTGLVHTEETKQLLHSKLKGMKKPDGFGAKIRAANLCRGEFSLETRQKIAVKATGRVRSPESIRKQADKTRGVPKPKSMCPHCGTVCAHNILVRYHLDKCKYYCE